MINHINKAIKHQLNGESIKNASMKVLISPKDGWKGHVMRVLDLQKDGYTPKHSHPWYHVNYILDGEGELLIGNEVHKLSKGSYAYVPANTIHQFRNTGDKVLSFICIVIEEGHKL